MMHFKPEKHNGRTIARPHVVGGDGLMSRSDSNVVFHPPSIAVAYPLEILADEEAQAIVAMKAMSTSELRARLHNFALRVIANERSRTGG